MSELKHEQWAGTTYGNGWMHKWLIRFLRVVDMRLVYLFAFLLIVPPTASTAAGSDSDASDPPG